MFMFQLLVTVLLLIASFITVAEGQKNKPCCEQCYGEYDGCMFLCGEWAPPSPKCVHRCTTEYYECVHHCGGYFNCPVPTK
uniref:Uncharacterized protein n=1 Tax=Globodera rostochiensis TaxID=31243 RepID=A0A914I4L7_GLORO